MYPQLCGKAVGGGGFPGGAGTGQHHHSGIALTYHVGDLGKPLLMQSFVDPNQFPDLAGLGLLVQLRNGSAFHQSAPMLPFREYGKEIRTVFELRAFVWSKIVRIEQDKAALSGKDVPNRQIAGGRKHLAKEVIGKILIVILVEILGIIPSEQLGLVQLVIPPILRDGVTHRDTSADQGKILTDITQHLIFQCINGKTIAILNGNIDAVSHGAADFRGSLRPELSDPQENQEAGGAGIYFLSGSVGIAQ